MGRNEQHAVRAVQSKDFVRRGPGEAPQFARPCPFMDEGRRKKNRCKEDVGAREHVASGHQNKHGALWSFYRVHSRQMEFVVCGLSDREFSLSRLA